MFWLVNLVYECLGFINVYIPVDQQFAKTYIADWTWIVVLNCLNFWSSYWFYRHQFSTGLSLVLAVDNLIAFTNYYWNDEALVICVIETINFWENANFIEDNLLHRLFGVFIEEGIALNACWILVKAV